MYAIYYWRRQKKDYVVDVYTMKLLFYGAWYNLSNTDSHSCVIRVHSSVFFSMDGGTASATIFLFYAMHVYIKVIRGVKAVIVHI